MAWFIFHVPLKGSFLALAVGALVYVPQTTGWGMLISSFTRTQIAALFGTAILTVLPATQFSGMLTPVSSLTGVPTLMGKIFPMTYFVPICVGKTERGSDLPPLGQTGVAFAFRAGAALDEFVLLAKKGTMRARLLFTLSNIFWLGTRNSAA